MEIIWKRLIYQGKDYGDFYLVSNTGEIKGVKTGKIRSKNINHEGYYFVSGSLGSRNNKKTFKIHKAVAETFMPNLDDSLIVNHKDGDKLNNNIDNLEWCTHRENIMHAIENNLLTFEYLYKRVKNNSTGIIYESITEAAKIYNPRDYREGVKNICNALNGKNNTAYGCIWEYIS